MIDWTQMEHGALANFLAAPGPVKSGLEKFIAEWSRQLKANCAAAMATLPRDPECASDYAAKAQALDEFWSTLADYQTNFARPLEEPTLQGLEE
jgi:hypothetical protein